jgi:hypothetical protein
MAIPKSLYQPLRQGQLSVGSGWRFYFAPFNLTAALATSYSNVGPALIDLQNAGPFNDTILSALSPRFTDLGLVKDCKVNQASKTSMIRTGHRNVVRALYTGDLAETFEIKFMERSRIVDQISSGMQVFNLLSNPGFQGTITGPLTASGATATPIGTSGYLPLGVAGTTTANQPTLMVPAGSGALFTPGNYIVCDQDFVPGTGGYIGDSAAFAFPGTVTDVDFVRKTSDYVARVVGIVPTVVAGQDALVLNAPFAGGGNNVLPSLVKYGPTAGAKIQLVKGTVRRNGGSKINEWTALGLLDTEDGSQFALYYPRAAVSSNKGMSSDSMTDATGLSEYGMDTEFTALGFDDPTDGETVLSYLAYYPNANQSIQI